MLSGDISKEGVIMTKSSHLFSVKKLQVLNIIMALAIINVATWCQADDEIVSWGNIPGRNMVLDAQGLPVELTDENVLWKHEMKSNHLYGQPAIVGDKLLIGLCDNLTLPAADGETTTYQHSQAVCLDLDDGALIWRLALGYSRYGVCATYAIEDDRIYFISNTDFICADIGGMADGNDGATNELELLTTGRKSSMTPGIGFPEDVPYGDVIWSMDLAELKVKIHDAGSGTPLIIGDTVWVTTSQSEGEKPATAQMKGPDDYPRGVTKTPIPNIVVADKMTGELLAVDEQIIPRVFHGQWSSLAAGVVDGRQLIFWGDGHGIVHAFAVPEKYEGEKPIHLEEVWKCDANPHDYRYEADGSEWPYAFSHRGKDQEETHKRRFLGPAHPIGTPVFHEGRLYVGIGRDMVYNLREGGRGKGQGALTCIDPDGRGDITKTNILWQNREVGRTHSTVSIQDGLLYMPSTDGFIYCVDIKDGGILSKQDLGHAVADRSQLLADGKIYVTTDKREMYVIEAGRELKTLWSGKTEVEPATPLAWKDRLIIATKRGVIVYKKGANPDSLSQ